METINIQNDDIVKFEHEEVEAGVAAVKAAVGHLDRDILNIVLLSSLVQNCHHHAKLSPEFEQARAKFGHEPTWGGGEVSAKCGDYQVSVEIKHDTSGVVKSMIAQALAEGKNPLEALLGIAQLEGDGEPCNCPNCTAERNSKH